MSSRLHPGEVTRLLQQWKDRGDKDAEARLFAVIEQELTKLAAASLRRHPGRARKIDPRELVSEAYLALREYPIITANRGPFFRLMAGAMRHFLLDLVDRDRAAKRPPSLLRVDQTGVVDAIPSVETVAPIEFYEAIDALGRIDRRQAQVVELRILGLSNDEIAADVGISRATLKRDLKQARAFLAFQLDLPSTWLDA